MRVIPTNAAYAIGRFRPQGPVGYKAPSVPDAPLRSTKAEAEADWFNYWRCPACDVDGMAPHNGLGDCPVIDGKR